MDYTLGILQVITSSPDFGRLFSFRKSDESLYLSFIDKHKSEFLDLDYSEHDFKSTFRILSALNAWINEKKENDILNLVDIDPGDLYFATENTKWLLNAFYRMIILFQIRHLLDPLLILQNRIQTGIKSELIPLTSLRGIGRVYARRLFNSGFTTLSSLNSASVSDISKVPQINSSLANKIKEQLKDFESNESDIR